MPVHRVKHVHEVTIKQYSGTLMVPIVTPAYHVSVMGQSDMCDVETGHCIACQNHTIGTYCENCVCKDIMVIQHEILPVVFVHVH